MSRSMFGAAPELGETDWARTLAPLGPRRLKAIIDVSNKCNLRCRMCHFSFDSVFRQPAAHMTPSMFARIAESVLPHAHTLILSAGNEPLVSPYFIEILRIAAEYAVPDMLFITNAQLLTPRVAEAVIEAGVTQVQISADGATKQTYEYIRRGARFETLLSNLEYLTKRKRELGLCLPRLQFNVVLMRSNLEELELYVDLAEQLGVEWIAARHLLQVSGLGMEVETLAHEPLRANEYFARFLERVDRSESVTVISFPDFFEACPTTADVSCVGEQPGANGDGCADVPGGGDDLVVCGTTDPRSEAVAPTEKRSLSERVLREIARVPRNVAKLWQRSPARQPRPRGTKREPLPFGHLDLPVERTIPLNNAVQLEGWALDDVRVDRITIERERSEHDAPTGGNERGYVTVGDAKILNGSRPDVGRVFPNHPCVWRAGWTFELRREMLDGNDGSTTNIRAVAHNMHGRWAVIGERMVVLASKARAAPYLFCARPFDSVFIDSRGDVRPYADCRVEAPYGSLSDERTSFQQIWYGTEFRTLRQQIVDRLPPAMCLTCAHFINRNVDDSSYFTPR